MSSTTIEIPPSFNKSVFKFGSTATERASDSARQQLRDAEKNAQEAAQRVEAERLALEARQVALEHQTAKVNALRTRLRTVEGRDFTAQLRESERIFDTLFGSPELSEPNKRISLESATLALAWIPKAQERQGLLAEKLKIELAEAEKELAITGK